MAKNSNLKIEKIQVYGIKEVENPIEITLKFDGKIEENSEFEYFLNPIDNGCKKVKNAQIQIFEKNLKIEETFKVSNLYNLKGLNNTEKKDLALTYLLGFNFCFKSEKLFGYFIPLFEHEFNWKLNKNKEEIIKKENNVKIKLIKGEGILNENGDKSGEALIKEYFDVPVSIVKFRYANRWVEILEISILFKEQGDYNLLINRINDDCKITKNSIEYKETGRQSNSVSKMRFSNNGFSCGFIICVKYKLSKNDKFVTKVEQKISDTADTVVNAISTAHTKLKNSMSIKRREKRTSSGSKTPTKESPRKVSLKKSSEMEEEYKIVAKIRPLFYQEFVKDY